MSEPQQNLPIESNHHGFGLSALITTGFVSAVAAFSASLLYFHYFPQVKETPAPIAVVDMVKLGMAVTKMSADGDQAAFLNAGRAVAMLKEYGYIVLDSRMVIAAPDHYVRTPAQIIEGAPDMEDGPGGYTPPQVIDMAGERHVGARQSIPPA
ncbi:hypothetical protein [Sutterella sp.]|uniref:hypothetical protein n=1 Tax=Sutterella sp. TaxID=1981025 RepID=UPI003FD86EF1